MLIAHVLQDKGGVVHTLSAEATLREAAEELHKRKVGALVVMNDGSVVIGVFSERDVVRELARGGVEALEARVATAMSRTVVFATPSETVDEGLARMTDRRIRHLPVLDGDVLIGIVSIGDLVKHRIAAAEAESAAMQAYIATH